jgi:broad specificity phosphatase PhoE
MKAELDSEVSDNIVAFSPVTVRFYLVRHGETIANNQGLVVGQWDSPLSDKGKEQAAALGRSQLMQSTIFWRKYSSDLGRTQETAHLIYPMENDAFILDARIREIAKGARQEYPKTWDYERSVRERQGAGKEIPLLESSEDAWKRIADFIATILKEAHNEFGSASGSESADGSSVTVNVLVVSHAGALRTLLQKMASHAHPALQHQDDPSKPPDDRKRLQVPNTSVTILEVTPKRKFWEDLGEKSEQKRRLGPNDDFFPKPGRTANPNEKKNSRLHMLQDKPEELWDTRIVEFMWTKHLDAAISTSNDE